MPVTQTPRDQQAEDAQDYRTQSQLYGRHNLERFVYSQPIGPDTWLTDTMHSRNESTR